VNSNIDVKLVLKLLDIIGYISKFNQSVSSTSKQLHVDISEEINKDVDMQDSILKLLQYQDIMSQQLDSSVFIIDKVDNDIKDFINGKLDGAKLLEKLSLDCSNFEKKFKSFELNKEVTEECRVDFF
jgi:hypothetical protein